MREPQGERSMEIRSRRALTLAGLVTFLVAGLASATSVIPITDAELYQRADVVVHGTVISTEIREAANGDPETVVRIRPIEVLKGGLATDLILRQPGGQLPDGRFFRLWGRPEYQPDSEVVVFALALPEGGYTTAEMFLGKLDVMLDEEGARFATAPLHAGVPEGVTVRGDLRVRSGRGTAEVHLDSAGAPRPLGSFLDYLRNGARGSESFDERPAGALRPVRRKDDSNAIAPDWGPIGSLWRYSNGASAGWVLDGTANITGGGIAEATRALATWTNEPNSTINQYVGGSNPMHLNATSSSCGWTTCLTGGGVIGCGGPRGGGSHTWRSQTWNTITGGEVWLRCYATLNLFSSTITESVLLHEIGHTLGFGHSDQDVHPQDTCRGDEGLAIMRSTVQSRTTLGTDDVDAVRWVYGDGGKSCSSPPPPTCSAASIATQPTSRTINSGQSTTMSVVAAGTTPISYQWFIGTSGTVANPVSGATGSSLTVSPAATTSYWVRVTNACGSANSQTATVTVSTSTTGAGFYTLPPCRVLDTRNANGAYGGPSLSPSATRTVAFAGRCGIPATARAVSMNVTVIPAQQSGFLTLYPSSISRPNTTTISFSNSKVRANNAVIGVASGGSASLNVYNGGTQAVHFIIDVNGYFQ